MSADDHRRDNERVGSAFYPPIIDVPRVKQNGGVMHTPNGHINHFWCSVSGAIVDKMKGCDWQVKVNALDDQVADRIRSAEAKLKEHNSLPQTKHLKAKLRRIRKKARQTEDETEKASLEVEADQVLEDLREVSATTAVGDYNLVIAGLKEFTEVLKNEPKKKGRRPNSDIEFVLWKAIETQAGGKLDLKQSGRDQTNAAALNSLQNCRLVFDALLGMYPVGHDVHQWLTEQVVNWEGLGNALYDVGVFMKSQQKRCPAVLDEKLFRLWYWWETTFPGKSFNKKHGLFCTFRNFGHVFEMGGRVSEESNEAYNGTLKNAKRSLARMPSNVKRINKINERGQGTLKQKVYRHRLAIKKSIQGKARGQQKKRNWDHAMSVSMATEELKDFDGERYVVLSSGSLLPEEWLGFYQWFGGGKAPKDWVDRFDSTAPETFTDFQRTVETTSRLV